MKSEAIGSFETSSSEVPVPISKRITAAALASALSALVVTPFDVIKTRMQISSVRSSGQERQLCRGRDFPVRASLRGHASNVMCNVITSLRDKHVIYYVNLLRAGSPCPSCMPTLSLASLAYSPSTCCLDGGVSTQTRPGMLQTFRNILRQEGAAYLWRGLDSAMLLSIPMVGIYMPLYDHMHERLRPDFGAYAPALAGMGARTAAVFITAPLELHRTRQQAGTPSSWSSMTDAFHQKGEASGSGSIRSSFSSAMKALLRGLSGMWQGVGVTLARDVPFTALYWCTLEPIRSRLLSHSQIQSRESSWSPMPSTSSIATEERPFRVNTDANEVSSISQVLWANLVAGSISGALAAAATTPFDVVKTRLQTVSQGSRSPSSSTALDLRHVCRGKCPMVTGTEQLSSGVFPMISGRVDSNSMLGLLRDIYRDEGIRGLFAGVVPRVARAAPACAIVIATYEVLKTSL